MSKSIIAESPMSYIIEEYDANVGIVRVHGYYDRHEAASDYVHWLNNRKFRGYAVLSARNESGYYNPIRKFKR